jgi:hypothetical protein
MLPSAITLARFAALRENGLGAAPGPRGRFG